MAQDTLGARGALLRMLAAILLVLLSFNPSGYSFYHWIARDFPQFHAGNALVALLLLIGWVVYLNATLRSLGVLGITLVLAFFATLVWFAVEHGWLKLGQGPAFLWVVLIIAGLVLGIGMCWSYVRRRLSGQADVDDVNLH
ncbi:MAG: DUF6524 family protein [Steroidobacteraceae bacterium]